MNIQQMIEEDNYLIVLDTNVLLNVYKYSPEFSEFALDCLRTIKNYIILPATVRLEYGKHCRAEFSKMQGRVRNAGNETSDQIKRTKQKVLATCDNLERLQFPDVDELRDSLRKKLDEVQTVLDDFFKERAGLELISHSWNGTDYVMNLVSEMEQANQILPTPTQEDIYIWCEEGEKRYKKQIPPGFKDAKDKDGVRKYSDLIWWKEVLRFAKKEQKNIILVTDDVKADWWQSANGSMQFHQNLLNEFARTGQQMQPFISRDFYTEISATYGIHKTDAVELALNMTDDDYCKKIAESVFEEVAGDFTYSNVDYIDTTSAHIGTEGIDELEVTEHEFLSAKRVDRNGDIVIYEFRFQVTAEGMSYDYWGRDDDTKEVIRSYGTYHVFEGEVVVEITREAYIYLDFEDDDSFESVEIISGDLKEISFEERWPSEEYGEIGNCPDCGCPLDIENDGGNGFCIHCAPNH